MKLFNDHDADPQARAVLAYVPYILGSGIESSWSHSYCEYQAEPEYFPWFNGRERGYVIVLRSNDRAQQLNIAFFEHRNSDFICAIRFEKLTFNPPRLADVPEGTYANKYDVSHEVSVGKAYEMAEWIARQLSDFWDASFNANLAQKLDECRLNDLNDRARKGTLFRK